VTNVLYKDSRKLRQTSGAKDSTQGRRGFLKVRQDSKSVASSNISQSRTKSEPVKSGQVKSEPTLLPTGRSGVGTASIIERTRNPRLNGADIYVARFGGQGKTSKKKESKPTRLSPDMVTPDPPDLLSRCGSSSSEGSLHNELVNPNPKPSRVPLSPHNETIDPATVHASRPCYRCVAYMHSVGIRRVFWTMEGGGWESAKVRDLVDALDGGGDNTAGSGCAMFVTKHEVLMMRRMMGNS
jgi:hypothetical protein